MVTERLRLTGIMCNYSVRTTQ